MLTLKRKKVVLIIVEQSGKRCQNIFYWVKKDLFGCFRIEEIRANANETDLKERERIEMSTTVLPFTVTIITI